MQQKVNAEHILEEARKMYHAGQPGCADLFRRAADLGSAEAMFRLGYCCAQGYDHIKSEEEAFYWYERSAKAEYPRGLYYASMCLARGEGCPANPDQALLYARKAARKGYLDAQDLILEIKKIMDRFPADDRYEARAHMPEDLRTMRRIISKIVNRGNPNELYSANLPQLEIIGKAAEIDSPWTLKQENMRAERGDSLSMLRLGLLYMELDPREVNPSPDEGYRYLMLAAQSGNIMAMKWLVSFFAGGEGGPYLPYTDPDFYFIPHPQPHFAWHFLRMISWIHIDGLLALEDWYENGRMLSQPDFILAADAAKEARKYHIFPKKYYPDWTDFFQKEKETFLQAKTEMAFARLYCLKAGEMEIPEEEEKNLLLEILEGAAGREEEIASLLAWKNKRELLDMAAEASCGIASAISEVFRKGVCSFSGERGEKEITKDPEAFFRYRIFYYAKKEDFLQEAEDLIHRLIAALRGDSCEEVLAAAEILHTLNCLLTEKGHGEQKIDAGMLEVLRPQAKDLRGWQMARMHTARMRFLRKTLMAEDRGKAAEEYRRSCNCYPAIDRVFSRLPQRCSSTWGFTKTEEALNSNRKVKTEEGQFSEKPDRLDMIYDSRLIELSQEARQNASGMIKVRKGEYRLLPSAGWDMDNRIEAWLDRQKGCAAGFWPSLQPVSLLRIRKKAAADGKEQETRPVIFSVQDSWALPEEWRKALAYGRADTDILAECMSRTPEEEQKRRCVQYVSLLLKPDVSPAVCRSSLFHLYRYICFRRLWQEAFSEVETTGALKEWCLVYQALADLKKDLID